MKKNKGKSIFWLLVVGVHNRSTISSCVYQVSTLQALQKSVIKNLNVLEFVRKKTEEIKE